MASSSSLKLEDFLIQEELMDVREILKKRKERFRFTDQILEELIADGDHLRKLIDSDRRKEDNSCQQNVVRKVKKIDFKRTGLIIFNDAVTNQLFDEENLYEKFLQTKPCNHQIFDITEKDLHQNLLKGLFKHKMKVQEISIHLCKHLFYLMSVHSSVLLVDACFETLKFILQNTSKTEVRSWIPDVDDIRAVFVNYGASKELLELNDVPISMDSIFKENNFDQPPKELFKKNIYWVYKYVNFILSHNKEIYSIEELDQLLIMFLIVSLDRYFLCAENYNYALIAKSCCKILDAYPDLDSKDDEKLSELGMIICAKLKNINLIDVHFVINCCVTNSTLGHKLGQAISWSVINDRIYSSKPAKNFYEVTAEDIKRVLSGHRMRELDYHNIFYILMILDRYITSMIFTTNYQTHLGVYNNLLSCLKIKLPDDDADAIDYNILKELITRMAAVWKLSIAEMM